MVLQGFLVPQLNPSPIKMDTDELKFVGIVYCKEVKEGNVRQNQTFLCGHAIVSGETETAELAGQVAAGPKVVSRCDL